VAETFRCTLVTPEKQVLDEQVTYASIPAWDGQIGLMHQRAPLLVKLGDGLLRLDVPTGGAKWFFIGGGFAQMKDDKLSIVTGEAAAPEEVVVADAQAALKEAEARVAVTDEDQTKKQRALTRARALIELAGHGANTPSAAGSHGGR